MPKEAVCDLLLRNISYLSPEMTIVQGASIAIENGLISAIFSGDQPLPAAKRTLEGEGLLWMPGLADGHTHTSQQLLRGRLLDEKPVIWKRVNVPFESRLTEESSKLSAELAALEMIKNGTTGFVDAGGKYAEVFAEVYEASGLRGRLTYMTNDNPYAPESLRTKLPQALDRLDRLRRQLNGRLRAYYSVTALTAASEELFRSVLEAAQEAGIPAEVHMNEYSSEVLDFIERYGARPLEYLEQNGLLKGILIAPHCIFLSESEMEILQNRDVRVMHCPFSNCGKGVPPTPVLLTKGITVGFGTDGSAHGGADLFREMRLFRSLMQVHWGVSRADSEVMPAETLLRMATQGGAAALDLPNGGAVRVGAAADLIALDIDQPHLYPTQNLVHSLVESAVGSDVQHMIVDGNLIMENRRVLTLDEARIKADCKRILAEQPFLANWK